MKKMSIEVFALRKMWAITTMFVSGQIRMKIYAGLSFNEKVPDVEIVPMNLRLRSMKPN